MICAIESKYNEQYLKEVNQYGCPHISEKVECLALDNRYLYGVFLERVQPEIIAHIVCMHIYLFKKKQEEEREVEIISDSFIKLVANRTQQ